MTNPSREGCMNAGDESHLEASRMWGCDHGIPASKETDDDDDDGGGGRLTCLSIFLISFDGAIMSTKVITLTNHNKKNKQ